MRKILSLFFALMMAFSMSAKVAFLVPANDTNRESLASFEIDGAAQDPERRAYDWFKNTFVTPDNGQFISFADLDAIPSDINAIWIYVDRFNFNESAFDALFTSAIIAKLQAYVNAGGNLYLCKQATRLEKELVGATNGQSSEAGTGEIIYPSYESSNIVTPATWSVKYNFNSLGSCAGHAMFKDAPYKGDTYAELIWTGGKNLTNNNCLFTHEHMGMTGLEDSEHFNNFQTRNNCKVLGCWGEPLNGCYCGGIIEFYPTGARKGTVIMNGLAAYQFIINNAGNGWENTKVITQSTLNYLNARPCAGDNTTPMEDKLANDSFFYPSNTTTFRTLHPVCEDMAAAYSIASDPNGIARIHEGKLQFKAAGTVTLHIVLTESRGDRLWEDGDYEYDREITFAYADAQAAQDGPNFTWPSQFETGAVGPNSVITLPATVAELPVSYEVNGDASLEDNEMTLANVESGSVTVNASVTETGYHEAWPAGVYNYQNSLTFHAAEVGYLLPAAESIDHLKFSDDPDYQGQQPEYNAAKWFEDNYITCANPKGRFVTVDELPTLKAKGIKALWVNIERVNIDNVNGLLTACLTDDGLKTYIQAGGNVLLTKQATRLAFTMDRIGYAPEFNAGGYVTNNFGAQRSVATRMGISADEILDMSEHRLFTDMLSWTDSKNVYLVGETCMKTYNYCSWENFFTDNQGTYTYDNGNIQRLRDFETAWNATVFGIRGDIVDYCLSNIIEFNATGNWLGRILTIGSAAYQWGSANPTAELDNVKKLTANSLSYLLDEPLADEVYTRNGLTPGIYGTICFDYAVEAGHIEGAEIYELTSFNATNDGVILTQVDAMVAGRPYFFLATANELRLTYNGQRVAAGSYHGLVGHIGETTLHITPNDNNYILYNNELLLVNTDDIELPSYRAYINKYDEIPAYSEPTSNAPRRIMAIEPPLNAPTAVEAVDMQAAQGVYDIMGRKLSAPQGNGFYIINGQKVIITQ